MKKITALILTLFLIAGALCGCGAKKSADMPDNKPDIICTVFPQYDWVRQIAGERADSFDITMLIDSGADIHNFQVSAQDIIRISQCDLFVYVGGESDSWAKDVLKNADNKDMTVINMMDVLGDGVHEEEEVEGMQSEHSHEEEDEHSGQDEPEYDEHVWLSLKNAEIICRRIAESLISLDPDGRDIYNKNLESYLSELSSLDLEYRDAVTSSKTKALVFGDRFPFRYMTEDYGLTYYAAFTGCSAETEASFETIVFLAGKVDELGLDTVVALEGSDHKIADTVIANTRDKNQKIVEMDSMQSVTQNNLQAGISYIDIMEKNLEALKQVLK